MEPTVPTPMPCPAWCEHRDQPVEHYVHTLTMFTGQPTMLLMQTDKAGAFPEGMVRINYPADGHRGVAEMRPTLAADIGDIISALTIHNAADFAAALRRTHDLIGSEEWRVVPDPHPATDTTEGDAR